MAACQRRRIPDPSGVTVSPAGELLFANPASTKRERMTVRFSADDARSWSASCVIHEGPAAYSSLAVLEDRSIGLLYERGRNPAIDPPIGFSRAKVGVERMAINCAVCHTVRARLAADAEPQFYVGAAANTVDIQGYLRFLSRCAADDRFTPDHLIPAMAAKTDLSWLDRLMYRFVLIPYVRKRLLEQGEAFAWANQVDASLPVY